MNIFALGLVLAILYVVYEDYTAKDKSQTILSKLKRDFF